MTQVIPYIGIADLSAYLDGELDEERRMLVERLLAEQPEIAERLSEYRRRDAALRQAFGVLCIPGAGPLRRQGRFQIGVWAWRGWAAAVLCLALFAGGWWVYADSRAINRELAGLVRDATAAHILYLNQVKWGTTFSSGPKLFSPELARLLGGDSKSPDLSAFGFHLVGSRKLPDPQRPAVLFTYRDARGRVVSCYFQLAHGSHKTRFLSGEEAGFQVSYRMTPQLDYAVVGTLPSDQLQRIADAADTGIADDPDHDVSPSVRVMR